MTSSTFQKLIVCATLLSSIIAPAHTEDTKENCEYDMDLTKNVIKITCAGAPSLVNVYADTAHVSGEEEVNVSGDKGTMSKLSNNGRRRSNKELRADTDDDEDDSDTDSDTMSDHGHNTKFDFSKFETAFSNVVWNATQRLDDAKRKLANYVGSLKNISTQLQDGDFHLRTDMDNLRRTSNSATELKEGIIVAMRNQYNFMRSALLTHNYELKRVMDSLDVLVDVTADGFGSALSAHRTSLQQISYLNKTLTAVKKMVTAELRKRQRRMRVLKKGTNLRDCPKEISAIGAAFARKVDSQNGAYMFESFTPNAVSSVWIMKGSDVSNQFVEYDTATDIDYGIVGRYYTLPFKCKGTGHVIFRRHFYCHVPETNTVMKYKLKSMNIISEVYLTGSGLSRYPYKSRQSNTDVDLAVDEKGLWAIYATEESNGKMVISKINHKKMEVEKTWFTPFLKTEVANTFMICGVLYATDSATEVPTYIRYIYDTEKSQGQSLEQGQLPFANSAKLLTGKKNYRQHHSANSVMLSYDFRLSTLYSWSNGEVEMFPVYFKQADP